MFRSLTVNQVRKLKQARTIIIWSGFLGLVYAFFSDGFTRIDPYLNALIVGILVGLTISILELYFFSGGLRKLTFLTILILRTLLYVLLIFLIIFNELVIYRMIKFDLSYSGVLNSEEFQNYLFKEDFPIVLLYSVVFAFSINFTRMTSRKMGQGMLLSFITGTYYEPKVQERIFMFINIKNSGEIAENLGLFKFHSFLNDFFYDITESIVFHSGIIYQYVEDEIVISWDIDKGIRNANCIRTFFEARNQLREVREDYYRKYGFSPKMRAGLHCGNVVRAEIGDVKSEIVFHGDVMNTSARILNKAAEMDEEILISSHLQIRLKMPAIYQTKKMGKMKLKGKKEEIELFGIDEAELNTV